MLLKEKRKPLESNKCSFWWWWSINKMQWLSLKNIVELTQFIGHDPDQKVQTNYPLSVVSSKYKIVIFCSFGNTSATDTFGLMRVTEKRLTHFLFPVTALMLCGFWGGNENLQEIILSSPFFPTPCTRVSFGMWLSHDYSQLPRVESLLAG